MLGKWISYCSTRRNINIAHPYVTDFPKHQKDASLKLTMFHLLFYKLKMFHLLFYKLKMFHLLCSSAKSSPCSITLITHSNAAEHPAP